MTKSVFKKDSDSFSQVMKTYKERNKKIIYEWWIDLPILDVRSKKSGIEFDSEEHKLSVEEFLKTNEVTTLRSKKKYNSKNFRLLL